MVRGNFKHLGVYGRGGVFTICEVEEGRPCIQELAGQATHSPPNLVGANIHTCMARRNGLSRPHLLINLCGEHYMSFVLCSLCVFMSLKSLFLVILSP